MILHFTNINRYKLLIIFFVSMFTVIRVNAFSKQKKYIYLPDKSGFYCLEVWWRSLYGLFSTKKWRYDNSTKNSPSPKVEALNESLIRLFFSCGSPCNYSVFYDSKKGISKSYEFAIAVDIKREIIVVAEKNNLVAYKIFDKFKKRIFSIKRDWSPTAILFSDIIESKFIGDILYIKYLQGSDYREKTEKIHIKHRS